MLVSTLFLAALATGLAPISTTASPVSLNNNGHGQAPTSSLGPVVQLKQGSYAGNATLPGVVFFGGLPYAEPPLGDLRWRPPAKLGHHGKRKQQTVVDARNWGPLCIQQPAVNGIGQEDCLTLNVWKPDGVTEDAKLPVVVYIHGGGNFYNSAQGFPMNEWVTRSNGSVVAVSIQYRLGLLGFLASTNGAVNGTLTPNVGLLDQRFALEWVRDNIAAFGGDPGRVTISGESSGGGSVINHLLAYGGESNPPFHAAIGQSPANDPFPFPAAYEACFQNATRTMGCEDADDIPSCLRSASVGAIVSAVNNRGSCKFLPVIDGDLIRSLPSAALKKGAFAKVPFLGGHTTDDGSIFVGDPAKVTTDDQVKAAITNRYKSLSNATLDRMLELYPLKDFTSQGHRATVAFADTEFSCTPYVVARKMAEAGQVSYNYEWSAPDPVQLKARGSAFGALHTSDLWYLFQGTNSGPSSNNALPSFAAFNATESALSGEAVKAWTTFAVNYKPTTKAVWPAAPESRFVFRQSTQNVSLADAAKATTESAAAPVTDAHTARCDFWLEVGDERRL